MAEKRSPGRSGHKYRQLRARVFAASRICNVCGKQIDMTLRYPNPMSASLDHKDALARGGAPLDPANAAACHLVCNRRKGTKNLADVQPVPRSKDWYATPSPGG